MRVSLGSGVESWVDGSLGSISTAVAPRGDLSVRDRLGNWTYGLCVVVDDLRQDIGLVVRGRDLLDATADQIRLARLLGRDDAPAFHHHPLILRPDGSKLSKSSGDTGVRALRAAGWSAADVRRAAGDATGWTADPT
jgi:glutamyl-Q tRNA(Asp) synthetase